MAPKAWLLRYENLLNASFMFAFLAVVNKLYPCSICAWATPNQKMAKLTALLNAATTDLAPSGLVEEEGGKATFPVNQRLSFCKCTAIRNEMLSQSMQKKTTTTAKAWLVHYLRPRVRVSSPPPPPPLACINNLESTLSSQLTPVIQLPSSVVAKGSGRSLSIVSLSISPDRRSG